jgi:hypothetical protein
VAPAGLGLAEAADADLEAALEPNGQEPPQTPRRGVLRFLLVAARSMNGDAPAYAVAWHSSLLLLF